MKYTFHLCLLLFCFFQIHLSNASHVAGADLSYRCLGGDTFEFTMNIFRDCAGIGMAGYPYVLTGISTCGDTVQTNFTNRTQALIVEGDTLTANSRGAFDVSQLCSSALPSGRCGGGTAYSGIEQYVYVGTLVLSQTCANWTFFHTVFGGRNASRNGNCSNLTVVATMDKTNFPCNNSPRFESQAIPFTCAGRTLLYNFGAVEPDGDSLVYAFDCGYSIYPLRCNFSSPYSCNSPVPGITINSQTGKVSFTPTLSGSWILIVKVSEYERGTGRLKGSVLRDMLVVVQTCNNVPPINGVKPLGYVGPRPGIIQNLSGSAVLLDSNSIELCVGASMQFDVLFFDADSTDSLSISSNIQSVLPGAGISYSYPSSGRFDTLIATVSWSAVSMPGPYYAYYLKVSDNNCPIPGQSFATFDVQVLPATDAGPDLTICLGSQVADLKASGGTSFIWTALAGGAGILVPTNFSCDTCQNAQASPNVSTSYIVTSNLGGNCKNADTVTVKVAPNFNISVSSNDTICHNSNVSLSVAPSISSFTYSYSWSNGQFLINDTMQNPSSTNLQKNVTFTSTVESAQGCRKSADVLIKVSLPFPDSIWALASPSQLCLFDTVQLDVDWKFTSPPCAGQSGPCPGSDRAAYNFSWQGSGSNPNFLGSSNISNPLIYANLSTDTSYTVFIEDTLGVCFDTATVKVDAVSRYNVKPIGGLPICIEDGFQILGGPQPYNAYPGGRGRWSGPGIVNDSLGFFDPMLAGVGLHWISYEVIGSSCADKDSTQFEVIGLPDASFIAGPLCEIEAFNTLDTNASHIRGYFTSPIPGLVDSVTSNLDPTTPFASGLDSVPVVYHAFNGCWADSLIYVQLVSQFDASILTKGPFCASDDSIPLLTVDSGGHWSGDGVLPGYYFSPKLAGPGTHQVRVDSIGFCGNSSTRDLVVVRNPDPKILDPGPMYPGVNWGSPIEVFADQFDPGGIWGAPTSPPWMPFTTQALFVPSAVIVASGTGFLPLTYSIFDTLSNGKVCAGTDTVQIYFCNLSATRAFITTTSQGDLEANPKSHYYWWYDDLSYLGNKGDSIFENPIQGRGYGIVVGDSNQCWVSNDNFIASLQEPVLDEIVLLPNPASDEIFVIAEESLDEIELYDVEGKLLRRIQSDGLRTRIDLHELQGGMYFLIFPSQPEQRALRFVKF